MGHADGRICRWLFIALGVTATALPPAAVAGGPAAIVEEISGPISGIEILDYLESGRKLVLGPATTVTLGYLQSCLRETVRGGSLVVGETQSQIFDGASVDRSKTDCDGARLRLTADQAGKSGVVVFRAPIDATGQKQLPEPDLVLYGRSPLIDARDAARLIVERLDLTGERWEIELKGQLAPSERFFDCIRKDIVLALGGTYRISADGRALIVRIHPFAVVGPAPIVARLVRL